MPHSSPTDAVRAFVAAMNRGDLDGALDGYAPGAAFVAEPGTILHDRIAIREALGALIALKPTLATHRETVVECGDLALYHSRWTMAGHTADGSEIRMEGHSADVLRRQADGGWKIVVGNPWGAAMLDAPA
jgi:ketosteroid isomerase-like protein